MAAYSPSRGFGYAVPRNDDVHEETTSFLSSFAPFGLEDLQKEKPIRRTQRAFLLGTGAGIKAGAKMACKPTRQCFSRSLCPCGAWGCALRSGHRILREKERYILIRQWIQSLQLLIKVRAFTRGHCILCGGFMPHGCKSVIMHACMHARSLYKCVRRMCTTVVEVPIIYNHIFFL